MVDALKKLDKKFLIIAGCMVFLPILFIIILAIVQGCSNKKLTYEKYESKMISAAEKYIKKEDKKLTNEGESYIIDLSTLVDSDYIKATEDALDDTCTGKVIVRRNGSSIKSNDGGFLNYIPSLKCDGYNSNSFSNLDYTQKIVL